MELREMLPCIADPTKYRVIGRIDVCIVPKFLTL